MDDKDRKLKIYEILMLIQNEGMKAVHGKDYLAFDVVISLFNIVILNVKQLKDTQAIQQTIDLYKNMAEQALEEMKEEDRIVESQNDVV